MNNINITGCNGLKTTTIIDDNLDKNVIVSLDDNFLNKFEEYVTYSNFFDITNNICDNVDVLTQENDDLKSEIESLKKENKNLKKIIAKLNTRVNGIIAEKQLKEFYEKHNNNKCVSSVVGKQQVLSN